VPRATMLHVCRDGLAKTKVVLASQSPRRKELMLMLMQQLMPFDVVPSTFDEKLDKASFATAADYASETAMHKAKEVFHKLTANGKANGNGENQMLLVIGSDTVVDCDGVVMEKPADREDAFAMLRKLSGRTHRVHTGVTLCYSGWDGDGIVTRKFAETTCVTFSELADEVIEAYIASGEPMDKAGAYGIQGMAGSFVEKIDGCYFNVVGLPLNRLSREIIAVLPSNGTEAST